jgi:flagellar basal-body rod protein FlgF/flagellar basal-body rod protein FlgG
MDSGYYAILTGLVTRSQALDTAANNLANANTNGFRAERDFFRGALLGADAPNSQLNSALNGFGVVGGNGIDRTQGQLTRTGNPLDVAIEGQGFLAVRAPAGTRYTRDGALSRAADGTLVSARGEAVLDTAGRPIVLPPGETAIALDGSVSVAGGIVGRIQLAEFAPTTPLVPEGAGLYRAPTGTAQPATAGALHQGMLESSNMNVIDGTMQLLLLQKQAEMMQKALSMFHTEFNKTATEELSRVS